MKPETRNLPVLALVCAVACVSCSAIVTRFTAAAPLAVAGWRLLLAAAILMLLPQARAAWRGLDAKDLARIGVAALFLAVHFGAWIASLRLLPVSASVILVSMHPVFVLLVRWLGGEAPEIAEVIGMFVALNGVGIMQAGRLGQKVSGEPGIGQVFLGAGSGTLGIAMALIGAAALAGYLLIGASVRQRLRTGSYLLLVNSLAAFALFAFLLGANAPVLPARNSEYLLYLVLALVPTLGGHGLFAYAVGHLRPVAVSVAFLAEPVVATLLAIPIFLEVPSGSALLGGILVLGGLALVVARPRFTGRRRDPAEVEPL